MQRVDQRLGLSICAVLASLALAMADAGYAEGGRGTIFVPGYVIYPGDVISDDALVERRAANAAQAGSFGSDKHNLVGKVARRTLIAGQPIPASALRDKDAVVQGRSYSILYRSGVLTISGSAVPLKSAAAGETISVRNPETGIVMQAIVQAGGTLLVEGR